VPANDRVGCLLVTPAGNDISVAEDDHPRPGLKGGASLVDTMGRPQRGGLDVIIFGWGGRNAKGHGPILPQIVGLALPVAVMSIPSAACVPGPAGPSEHATPASVFDDTTPRFSPDGKDIVFVRETDGDSDLYVVNVRNGDERLLADVSDYDLDPVFSQDGTHVLFETSPNGFAQLHLVPSAGGTRSRAISDVGDGWATFPSWSPEGDMIVYSCGRPSYEESDLCLLSPSGEFLGLLGEESRSLEIEASWSPDGRTVAFASNRSGDSEVYLIDVMSGRVTRLTNDPVHDADPAWSPDGSQIAITSQRNGVPYICVMRWDGSDAACVTQGTQPSWSPDGARLTFYRDTPEGTRIFIADSDGSGVRQIA
jgi:TolB protein